MLRAAVQIGLFQVVLPKKGDPGVKFKNNKRSALLRDGHPNCLKHMVGRPAMKADYSPLNRVTASICFTATGFWPASQHHHAYACSHMKSGHFRTHACTGLQR